MPEYLIEECVLKSTLRHIPQSVWALFEDGPIICKEGKPFTKFGHERVHFNFDGFFLELPMGAVSEIDGDDDE